MINLHSRDDGIVIAITFWQWVLEFFINIIVIIVMARLGGSRQFDHFVSLTGNDNFQKVPFACNAKGNLITECFSLLSFVQKMFTSELLSLF